MDTERISSGPHSSYVDSRTGYPENISNKQSPGQSIIYASISLQFATFSWVIFLHTESLIWSQIYLATY